MNCFCGTELIGKQRKYCSDNCKVKDFNKVHKVYQKQREKGFARKKLFVLELGGKCSICNYDINLAALEFHHLQDKKFQIDMRRFSNSSDEVLRGEICKCVLLCANCHREDHNPKMTDWK